jgi:mono/diheme cytochrome c family protein
MRTLSLAVAAVAAATACSSRPAPTSFAEQAARGGQLYAAHCAECHGAGGEGDEGPRVVGLAQGALPLEPPPGRKHRKTRFVTVADVAAFVVANMPPKRGGSLPTDDYLAILAFDLQANGIDLGAQLLTMANASTLVIPR